jgi:hypothetical protein
MNKRQVLFLPSFNYFFHYFPSSSSFPSSSLLSDVPFSFKTTHQRRAARGEEVGKNTWEISPSACGVYVPMCPPFR